MRCPYCEAAELIHDTRDVPYTYREETQGRHPGRSCRQVASPTGAA
ncbi:type II toxin-antitoxin system MqsA family antitoxin [Pandoraea terrae]|nr:type II toxin-antitoxin system MqsA family antitoxin [Pandoraea terrae]